MKFTVFQGADNLGALLIVVLVALLGASSSIWGCDRAGETAPDGREESSPTQRADRSATQQDTPDTAIAPSVSATPRLVVSEDLPDRPERIVSLAPNITEILFELGAGERVVAVTRFCDYPPEAAELPKVGGVVDTDLEAILAERPELVVGVTSGGDAEVAKKLAKAGVAHAFVRMDDLEETYEGIQTIGELVDESERAEAIVAEMKKRIAESADDGAGDADRPTVLMLYGRDPLIAAGPGTFGHELVELAGGQNVLADAKTSYPNLDVEKVISLNPERIIDASEAAKDANGDFWGQYETIDAVAAGHVYPLRDPVVLRPAPRLTEGLAKIRTAIEGSNPP